MRRNRLVTIELDVDRTRRASAAVRDVGVEVAVVVGPQFNMDRFVGVKSTPSTVRSSWLAPLLLWVSTGETVGAGPGAAAAGLSDIWFGWHEKHGPATAPGSGAPASAGVWAIGPCG